MRLFYAIIFFVLTGCQHKVKQPFLAAISNTTKAEILNTSYDPDYKTIHVLVALCDNKYQGIVPVPAGIGNGQDPNTNLYWGCGYGVRTYFKNSKQWTLLKKYSIDSVQMERLVFKNNSKNYYLVADAWNGKYIQQCTESFFKSCAGQIKDTVSLNNISLGINGNAALLAYVGHDGLMDFKLPDTYKNTDGKVRDAIMLACYSKRFFGPLLASTKANPLLWSSGLMAPEAYVLHDALTNYVAGQPVENVRSAAAKAYATYQKCGEKAARNLLVTGY